MQLRNAAATAKAALLEEAANCDIRASDIAAFAYAYADWSDDVIGLPPVALRSEIRTLINPEPLNSSK